VKNYLYCSRPLCSFDGAMCVDSSPLPSAHRKRFDNTACCSAYPLRQWGTPRAEGQLEEAGAHDLLQRQKATVRGDGWARAAKQSQLLRGGSCAMPTSDACTNNVAPWSRRRQLTPQSSVTPCAGWRWRKYRARAYARISQFHEKAFTASHQAHKPIWINELQTK